MRTCTYTAYEQAATGIFLLKPYQSGAWGGVMVKALRY